MVTTAVIMAAGLGSRFGKMTETMPMESDIIYSKNAITELQEVEHPNIMLITPVTKFQDQYYVKYDEVGTLTRCSTNKA